MATLKKRPGPKRKTKPKKPRPKTLSRKPGSKRRLAWHPALPDVLRDALAVYGNDYKSLANALGLPPTTVHGWMRRGRLPDWRAKQLAELGKK
jgi:hypothetical protein